jgi:hypothetical protein
VHALKLEMTGPQKEELRLFHDLGRSVHQPIEELSTKPDWIVTDFKGCSTPS